MGGRRIPRTAVIGSIDEYPMEELAQVAPAHRVHALPDLRIAGGRLGDGMSFLLSMAICSRKLNVHAFACIRI